MPTSARETASTFNIDSGNKIVLLTIALLAVAIIIAPAQAQTLSVLHIFGGGEGGGPVAGPTFDRAGNLYGTCTSQGDGRGTVYKLTHAGTGWVVSKLHTFSGGEDGAGPFAGVVFGPDGALYGTTIGIDYGSDHGTVFRLQLPPTICHSVSCPWTESVIYRFTGGADGGQPGYGNLVFDAAGNLYGTTTVGGTNGVGTVYKLTPSNGGWTESVLYSFSMSGGDGFYPYAGVVLDSAGNVYGTTWGGGMYAGGTVYQLTQSGSSWTETVLHSFGNGDDGNTPYAGLTMDRQGNLYGATASGPGSQRGGAVYELQPSGGSWSYSVLAALPGSVGPEDALTLDAAGNLYGTVLQGISGYGGVFKLTPSGGSWIYTALHDFKDTDGSYPYGSVALDAEGNVYGTTFDTFFEDYGQVWELTP